MRLGRTRVIPVAAILVASLVAGLPSSASAQEIMKRGFRALDTSTLMEPRVPSPKGFARGWPRKIRDALILNLGSSVMVSFDSPSSGRLTWQNHR